MLITTYRGIVVNTHHVAYVLVKQDRSADETAPKGGGPLFKVLLCLGGGDSVVAASRLAAETAEFLRKDIAHHWAEGSALLDVATSLSQREAGAYYTRDG